MNIYFSVKAIITNNEGYPDLCENVPYNVADIEIGQTSTSIKLREYDKKVNFLYNMKFYHEGKEINIFRSKAFNPYLKEEAKLIYYGEMIRRKVPKGLPF